MISGAVYGALVADAFSLGAHWEYDVDIIKKTFPTYNKFYDPITSYHKNKKAGDFTHYGDQTLWLLESVSLLKEFSLSSYATRWQEYMSKYEGYIDGASKATLENFASGKSALQSGSNSQDFSVVGRISSLVALSYIDEKHFEDDSVLQAKMTHNSQNSIDAIKFFSKLLYLVINGDTPTNAILTLQKNIDNQKIKDYIKVALLSKDYDTVEAINSFGQSCSTNCAFESTLHLILKYENSYEKAMKENVYAGGDSAARAMVTGMILGAYNGKQSIPKEWINSLNNKDRIEKCLGFISE